MKLQFDPNQPYQLDAVAAVTDLFDGQPQGAPEYAVIHAEGLGGLFAGQTRTELGVGHHLLLPEEKLHANTRAVQARNDIEVAYPGAPLAAWELFDTAANAVRHCLHFSVEMETGTGKTYVYLRTIFELSRRYGFQKFIIVVPSVAIREGVLKNIEITGEHFRALYNNSAGQLGVTRGGITATAVSVADEAVSCGIRPMPDILAYLQNETELTRSTLVRILKASGRLAECFVDPQRFMDAVTAILKYELHRLLVDGIKDECLPSTEPQVVWGMRLFKHEELVNSLTALQVQKSIYEYVVYDSEVERECAHRLEQRQDIKLFVKLPGWFEIDTSVGKYNPDWAILKEDDQTLYLVCETKATRDFLKLRTSEADKIRCGQRHFETLGVPFAVAVSADEV